MGHRNFNTTEAQDSRLDQVLSQTGLTFSELARRALDHVLQERVLNEIIPSMSGQLFTTHSIDGIGGAVS